MIFAGFILLAIGAVDLVRQFAALRWIGYLSVAVVLLLLGGAADALLPMITALVAGGVWVWCMPADRRAPAGFWPAVVLGAVSVGAVASMGARPDAGLIGSVWDLRSPFGEVPFDLALLALGAGAFLLESANLVVRAALDGEHTWRPVEIARRGARPTSATEPAPRADDRVAEAVRPEAVSTDALPADVVAPAAVAPGAASPEVEPQNAAREAVPSDAVAPDADRPDVSGPSTSPLRGGFQGGRLIGPLERVLVMMLTLAAAYPILAAMLAAKGIVRFPEISKDGETGARAEYFLVGSLVSWLIALGAAFLVWWAAHS